VLQEVFTGVWSKAGQFDPERASATTWLAMIARNKSIDRLRAQPAAKLHDSLDVAERAVDPGISPPQYAEAADERARLDLCLEQLDQRRRDLIRTAFFDGASYEELASRSGSPLGSVKSWIRRGLAQLRACLES
jgi:RNA polymerase sigma-70 factor (ECF subfamily)